MAGSNRKFHFFEHSYLVNISLDANITGEAIAIDLIDRIAFQVNWTGTPTGQFFVQVSNDKTAWVTLPLSEDVVAAGVADDALIDVETAARYIRLIYTRTSGTGLVSVSTFAKALN